MTPRDSSANANAVAWRKLVADNGPAIPYRATDEHIQKERDRFDRARTLVEEGRTDEARRVSWWPRDEDFPKEHWSRRPIAPCSCGKQSSFGMYALCAYCSGTTTETPSLIPRGRS